MLKRCRIGVDEAVVAGQASAYYAIGNGNGHVVGDVRGEGSLLTWSVVVYRCEMHFRCLIIIYGVE